MRASAGRAPAAERSRLAWRPVAWIIALTLALTACRMPYIPGVTSPPPAAGVTLADPSGRVVGSAVLLQRGGGVRILVDLKGVTPGGREDHG